MTGEEFVRGNGGAPRLLWEVITRIVVAVLIGIGGYLFAQLDALETRVTQIEASRFTHVDGETLEARIRVVEQAVVRIEAMLDERLPRR